MNNILLEIVDKLSSNAWIKWVRKKERQQKTSVKSKHPVIISTLIFTLTVSTILLAFNASATYSPGVLCITFDDGFASQYMAYQLMSQRGLVGTFYVMTHHTPNGDVGDCQLIPAQLLEMQNAGNEIGSHTATHRRLDQLTDAEIHYEMSSSKATLESYGLTVTNFAYPYGLGATDHIDSIISQYYRSARLVWGTAQYEVGFELPSVCISSTGWGLSTLKSYVNQVADNAVFMTVFFHDIGNGFSTSEFTAFLDYAVAKNIRVMTVNDALNAFNNPQPTPTPVITTTPIATPTPTATPTSAITPTVTPTPTTEPTPTVTPTPTITPNSHQEVKDFAQQLMDSNTNPKWKAYIKEELDLYITNHP